MGVRPLTLAVVLATVLTAFPAAAFMEAGCGSGDCIDCHDLSKNDAEKILGGVVDHVVHVQQAEVAGLWAIDVEKQGKKIPVYLDYSKKFLITGDVVRLDTLESLTRERYIDLNRVDVSTIPTDDAVVIGNPKAPIRIIVFDDPECPFCKKLHPVMTQMVVDHPDIVFFVKMLPLKIHPHARKKAEAIVCAKSAQMLQDSLNDKPVPEPSCKTDIIEKNEALAKKIGVRSTPTLVFPDGRVVPGYKPAEKILTYLERGAPKTKTGKTQKTAE